MERREQYDPEDIENLLQERNFDELLEEERAYVLRHLSGREEYEKMRALLLHVREDDHRYRPIEADERVRTNVLQAFRAQQQPQWRIWLNSVGGFFTPNEGYAMWRPALAIGMLILLFGVGFYLVNSPFAGPTNDELAEVRRQKAEEPLPAKKTEAAEDTLGNTATLTTTESDEEEAATERANAEEGTLREVEAAPAPPIVSRPAVADHAPEKPAILKDADLAKADMEVMEDVVVLEERSVEMDAAAPASGHVVTEQEFAKNQSMANATGKVQSGSVETAARKESARSRYAKAKSLTTTSRPVSEDPALLELLSAGW